MVYLWLPGIFITCMGGVVVKYDSNKGIFTQHGTAIYINLLEGDYDTDYRANENDPEWKLVENCKEKR